MQKELEILDKIINAPTKPENLRFEHQERGTDTCFIHATNMYFQSQYTEETPRLYSLLAPSLNSAVQDIIKKEAANSFYEGGNVSTVENKVEYSDPKLSFDLFGYYEIYKNLDLVEFAKV